MRHTNVLQFDRILRMFHPATHFPIDELTSEALTRQKVKLFVARLDAIHPVVSGNKLFKLHPFIQACEASGHSQIVTFGGPYSNHLAATAFYCKQGDIKAIGIVRGERPNELSHTLAQCLSDGMELHFVSRTDYDSMQEKKQSSVLFDRFGPCQIIPEGGFDRLGALGAADIMNHPFLQTASHICLAVGTATTLSGICLRAHPSQQIIGVPVLKNMTDVEERLYTLTQQSKRSHLTLFSEYHFGGYAKHTPVLLDSMNRLYINHSIPTDFVYTGKMMFGLMEQIQLNYFPADSTIVALHTGGLQGNASLPAGSLVF